MVRPALGDGGVYGVEGAGVPDQWAWRVGLLAQYERAPVLVLTEGEITSRPVTDRIGGWAGFSMGLGYRIAVQAVVPVAWQTGDGSALSADGAGIGDPRLGARWGLLHTNLVDATLRADVHLPFGRQDAWLGEGTTRASFGASGALKGGFGAVLLDVGIVARPLETPQPGLDWGPTVDLGLGVRADILPTFSAGGAWVARAVLAGLDTQDGELASELLLSATLEASPVVVLTAGGGAGLQAGVGVPTWRGFATATFRRPPPSPVKPVPVVEKPPPEPEKLLEEDPTGVFVDIPPPPPPPKVRVIGDEIVFTGEIKFKTGSAELLPESHEIIDGIANLLAGEGRIAHVAIEGHASEEGDLVYNWDLSDRRARAVWEALLLDGVSPQRMSWRGLGEVVPASGVKSEATHAENRRVVFRIANRLAQGEALPTTPASAVLPWSGEAVALDTVTIPAVIVPPKTDQLDPDFFQEEEE
ncbi:MAG: OmpA family protein [Pseudomonadota bacterium]|nr:OmpA family protein [Pseudomonadota bacterium]